MDIERAREILKIDMSGKKPEEILELADAYWAYQGFPGEPHAMLASGLHSDGYYNLNSVLQFSNLCEILAEKLTRQVLLNEGVDAVVSSSFAAIPFGAEVARNVGLMFVFTEKKGDEQVWSGRFELPSGTRVIQVEELITTLNTTRNIKKAVLEANPEIRFAQDDGKTVVATIVHRPAKLVEYPDYKVISLIELEIHNWEPEECPLCKAGSKALKPKPNWQEFQKFMRMKK